MMSPTARMAQPLCFEQIGFAPPQLFLRLLARMDVRQQVVPTDYVAAGVTEWEAARHEPPIFAVGSTEAMLKFVQHAGLDGMLPGCNCLRKIGRVHRIGRPPFLQLFK